MAACTTLAHEQSLFRAAAAAPFGAARRRLEPRTLDASRSSRGSATRALLRPPRPSPHPYTVPEAVEPGRSPRAAHRGSERSARHPRRRAARVGAIARTPRAGRSRGQVAPPADGHGRFPPVHGSGWEGSGGPGRRAVAEGPRAAARRPGRRRRAAPTPARQSSQAARRRRTRNQPLQGECFCTFRRGKAEARCCFSSISRPIVVRRSRRRAGHGSSPPRPS